MQQYIYKYFALNKAVSLPGIGSFSVEMQNAKLDFIDRTLYPKVYISSLRISLTWLDSKYIITRRYYYNYFN